VLVAPDEEPAPDSVSTGTRVRAIRDVTLGLCAAGYLALVLFDGVESPLLSLTLIILVARALIQAHARQR
jgi:hypothetical protein